MRMEAAFPKTLSERTAICTQPEIDTNSPFFYG